LQDEIEASRVAAINREIKRVLTEVLLKVYLNLLSHDCICPKDARILVFSVVYPFWYHLQVTDDLFDEIATKVLNEDDSSAECE